MELLDNEAARLKMGAALEGWNTADAAEQVATRMLAFIGVPNALASPRPEENSAAPATFRSQPESHVSSPPLRLQALEQ